MSSQNVTIQKFALMNGSCLVFTGDNSYSLDKNDVYFYQVQLQMYTTDTKKCDFVIWSKYNELYVETIHIDMEFLQKNLDAVKLNFTKMLLYLNC